MLVPHYNVEAGVKITVTDYDSNVNKMYGGTVDVTNRNVPLMTLLGQTRLVSNGDWSPRVCGLCRGRYSYERMKKKHSEK